MGKYLCKSDIYHELYFTITIMNIHYISMSHTYTIIVIVKMTVIVHVNNNDNECAQ